MALVEKSVEIAVPVRAAYNQWTQFEEFPRFMEGVESVRQLDDRHLHWRANIGGKVEEWDAEITEQIPDKRIAWRSTSGARNAGVVTFHRLSDDRSRVMLQMEYEPQTWAESLGDLFGFLSRRVEGDLQRFKEFMEARHQATGAWRGHIPSPDDERSGQRERFQPGDRTETRAPAERDQSWADFGRSPFGFMRRFGEEMDRLFEDFGFGLERSSARGRRRWSPQVDIAREGDQLIICADLPGLREEDLNVEAEDRRLVIRGERRQEHHSEEGKFRRSERRYGSFYRVIDLPEGAQVDRAAATFRNGVLEIRIPVLVAEQRRARRIAIQTDGGTARESPGAADANLNKSA